MHHNDSSAAVGSDESSRWKVSDCHVHEYEKPTVPISTGIGYFDHMIDQFYSHAQIGVSVQVLEVVGGVGVADGHCSSCSSSVNTPTHHDETTTTTAAATTDTTSMAYINRHATTTNTDHQSELLAVVGTHIGRELRRLWHDTSHRRRHHDDPEEEEIDATTSTTSTTSSSTFACPLDEALTTCIIEVSTPPCSLTQKDDQNYPSSSSSPPPTPNDDTTTAADDGALVTYTLPPYGHYPIPTGRSQIGALRTAAIVAFWNHLARASGFTLSLTKIRGHNAHHIVESSFKAFARALRNLLDGVDTVARVPHIATEVALSHRYGRDSPNDQASRALHRSASIQRNTKETSIRTQLDFDGGIRGIHIDTGIQTLNQFLTTFATYAGISLHVTCIGDLHIDEHHTAEDVAISIGQVLNEALGDKAGLNRMWSCPETATTTTIGSDAATRVLVVMDLSNRPCLTHNLSSSVLERMEMIGDLSCEMFEHVLESIVVNARMTVHIVLEHDTVTTPVAAVINHHHHNNNDNGTLEMSSSAATDLVQALARGLGQSLKYCAILDGRRAGATASSKGTLSV